MKGPRTAKPLSTTLAAAALAIVLALLIPLGAAHANNGPHGNYSATTDACAGCHRAHSAAAEGLLIEAVPNLCLSCHGAAASGAQTDVESGAYNGAGGGDLLGGGFVSYQGVAVTSSHSIDGSWQNAWGSGTTWNSTWDCLGCHSDESGLPWPGAPEWLKSPNALPQPYSGQNVMMPLTCTSCHEPHGGRNYRLLQQRMHPPTMQQEDPPGYVLVTSNETGGQNPDQAGYVPDYTTPRYRLGLGDWCTGCHFTYQQEVSVKPFNAEDGKGAIIRYRHKMNTALGAISTGLPLEQKDGYSSTQQATDQLFCGTCHYAHGSTAVVSGLAANVAPTNDSALLRLDNRGVCQDCHQK